MLFFKTIFCRRTSAPIQKVKDNLIYQGVILPFQKLSLRSFFICCLMIGLFNPISAETSVSQITLGGNSDDGGNSFLQVEGGLVFGGNTYSQAMGGRDALLFATDSNGTPVWSTTFGGSDNESITGMAPLPDGGYVTTGRTNSFGRGSVDLFFARFDAQGSLTHFKTYGGENEDRSMGLIPTQDDQFLIFGATRNGSLASGTTQDVLLIKVTAYGDVIWTRAYGGEISEVAYSVKETPEGDFVVFAYGDSWENQGVSTDMYLLKIDKNGDLTWTTCHGGSGYEMHTAASAGHIAESGDIYLMGATTSYGAGDFDQILMKYNSQGTLEWTRTIGGSGYDYGRGVIQTNDGNILSWGFITDPQNGGLDAALCKFSPDGTNIWTKVYGNASDDDIYRIQESRGDSLLMMGMTKNFGAGGKDFWIIRSNSEGDSDCNLTDFQPNISAQSVPMTSSGAYRGSVRMEVSDIDINTVFTNQNAFLEVDTVCTTVSLRDLNEGLIPESYYLAPNSPNPFNPETIIQFELPKTSLTSLSIFNVQGQLVQNLIMNEELPAGYYSEKWNGKGRLGKRLPSGVYICRMQSGTFIQQQEMLLLK